MTTESPCCLHEQRAHALRTQAMADFWRDADAIWARVHGDAATRLVRSTQRLQARLRRHRAARGPAA